MLLAIGVLYVVSIPWYRTPGEAPQMLLGLPDWVAVALLCYAACAVLNAVAWLLTDVPEREDDIPEGDDASPGRVGRGDERGPGATR